LLVVAVGPSFFNNNQRVWLRRLFWILRLLLVAAGCILILQAVRF